MKVPWLAWMLFGSSALVVSVGWFMTEISKHNLVATLTEVKSYSIAENSRILVLAEDLEKNAEILLERERAYDRLAENYQKLLEHNQPLKMLEPSLEEVNLIYSDRATAALEKEIEAIGKEAKERAILLAEEQVEITNY